jgi:hypothetical protein
MIILGLSSRLLELSYLRQILPQGVQPENLLLTVELDEISNHAVDCILQQAYIEPENREILSVPPPENGNTIRIMGILSSRIFTCVGI